jgi:hypothetical protein
MIDLLNKYLILHKSINIPGIGTITVETQPAVTDFINRQIYPPKYVYRFDKYFDSPGKDFFNYLAAIQRIPDYDAIKQYSDFAQDMRSSIKTNEKVLWKDVGYFKHNISGEVEFEPLEEAVALYEPVVAERIMRTNVSHAMLVGDQEKTSHEMTELLSEEKTRQVVIERKSQKIVPEKESPTTVPEKTTLKAGAQKKTWLVYASILFALALLILVIHFYTNGFSMRSVSNQQPVHIVQP